jgi:ABC-type multidrug transport system ATPase subunit
VSSGVSFARGRVREERFMNDIAIHVENLVKTYRRGRSEIKAVDGISFEVRQGSIFGLLGPNGAGKTTTLRVLTTLTRPTSGRAEILGYDVVATPRDVRRRIGVVIQEQAADLLLSVRDNLLTFSRFHGRTPADVRGRLEEIMSRFGLAELASRKVQDLSGGVRRRVQVAKMFMVDLPVIFLDEFSSGMDPLLKRAVLDLLRGEAAKGRTFVLTTHILSEAEELCDDILIINKGRQVAHGTVDDLKLLSERIYDVTMTFDRVPGELEAVAAAYRPSAIAVAQNTVTMTIKEDETRVLELVAALARHGRVQRVEISSASLEDVFVDLMHKAEATP